jgi:hypothetical protein
MPQRMFSASTPKGYVTAKHSRSCVPGVELIVDLLLGPASANRHVLE